MKATDSFSEMKELARLDDPAVRKGCVKLKRRSELETDILIGAAISLLPLLWMMQWAYWGYTPRHSSHHYPPAPALAPYAWLIVALDALAFLMYFAMRNYYLVDPGAQRVYHVSDFLWRRNRRVVFRQGEVLGLTTESQPRSSKYGMQWYYRLVLVGIGGRQEPVSNWSREGLEKWNAKAAAIAPLLQCQSFPAPPQSIVEVTTTSGGPRLAFIPASARPPYSVRRLAMVGLVIIIMILVNVLRAWNPWRP